MTDLLTRYPIIRPAIPAVFLLWTVLMLTLTLIPGDALPSNRLFSYDKVGHFGMFGGWTFFLGLYFMIYKEKVHINLFLLMTAGILFGAMIEVLQHIMPAGRSGSLDDIIANSLGCFTAYLLLHPVRNYVKRRK